MISGSIWHGTAYKMGVAFSALALVSAAILIWMFAEQFLWESHVIEEVSAIRADAMPETSEASWIASWVGIAMLSSLILFISAIGTALTVLLG